MMDFPRRSALGSLSGEPSGKGLTLGRCGAHPERLQIFEGAVAGGVFRIGHSALERLAHRVYQGCLPQRLDQNTATGFSGHGVNQLDVGIGGKFPGVINPWVD